eukprot:scaffold50592_cov46-Attheya_sp.AAC.5
MRAALVPAERASTTKLSGHASTISSVCVPMLPVDPSKLSRFMNVDPFNDSARVFFADAAEFTGADGLEIHPSPVPLDPDTGDANNTDDEVVRCADCGANA